MKAEKFPSTTEADDRKQTQTGADRLSVVILTYNEQANLPACLESLKGLDCEILLVDSGSTDATIEIARRAGATVFTHPFENYAAQRNWAQKNLPFHTNWVLHLDADERLTPALVKEITRVLKAPPDAMNGFLLRKRTIFMGRWIRHGGHYPSYHLRLFRTDHGICEDRLYDQHFLVRGKVGLLKSDYSDIITSDLTIWTLRHARWAELESQEIMRPSNSHLRVSPDPLGTPVERRRWMRTGVYLRLPLFARASLYWFYRYFIRLGFLDGKEGLIFHFLQGFWYRFLIDAKLYEARQGISNRQGEEVER